MALADEEYAYVTTRGRRTGRPHTVELWFAPVGGAVWFIAGGGTSSDWVANLLAEPAVTVRVGERTLAGRARTEPGDGGGATHEVVAPGTATTYRAHYSPK